MTIRRSCPMSVQAGARPRRSNVDGIVGTHKLTLRVFGPWTAAHRFEPSDAGGLTGQRER